MEKLARLGYATKGIVYGIIGILAVMAAFTAGGQTTGTQGALGFISAQPFGQFLLALTAFGLLAYAIWRLIEAILDPEHKEAMQGSEHKGSDAKSIAKRVGYAISGLLYGALAAQAILIVIGKMSQSQASSGGNNSKSDWTAWVMQQPFGRWIIGLVGAIIIGVGFYRIYKAYKVKFRRKLNLAELDREQTTWVVRISRIGIAARGVVFVLTGFFLLQASTQYDPNEVKGLDGILGTLAVQPYGKFLLALVAIGLVAYAIYMLVQSRYRRIDV
jgi:large-conductance mechanosensitive channel